MNKITKTPHTSIIGYDGKTTTCYYETGTAPRKVWCDSSHYWITVNGKPPKLYKKCLCGETTWKQIK